MSAVATPSSATVLGTTVVTPPGAPAPGAAPPVEPKIAGKYATTEEFDKGFRSLADSLGVKTGDKLIGDGGLYPDQATAVLGYQALTATQSKIAAAAVKPGDPLKIGGEPAGTPPGTPAAPSVADDVPTLLKKAGLEPGDLVTQFTTDGKLTDEQYSALNKTNPGLSKPVVDQIARGLMAESELRGQRIESVKAECATLAGGKEQLAALLSEAKNFVPKDMIAEFDRQLSSVKPGVAAVAVRTLMTMHAESVGAGKSSPIIQGQPTGSASGAKDAAEFGKLMRSAAMGNAEAQAKIAATPQERIESWKEI